MEISYHVKGLEGVGEKSYLGNRGGWYLKKLRGLKQDKSLQKRLKVRTHPQQTWPSTQSLLFHYYGPRSQRWINFTSIRKRSNASLPVALYVRTNFWLNCPVGPEKYAYPIRDPNSVCAAFIAPKHHWIRPWRDCTPLRETF